MEANSVEHKEGGRDHRRSRYSYLKCVYCRKDKQKCIPHARQWPSKKCRRCEQKGFACSESQRTNTRNTLNVQDPLLASQAAPLLSPSSQTEDPRIKECLHALDWMRLLQRIRHVMLRIHKAQEHRRRIWSMEKIAFPKSIKEPLDGLEYAQGLIVRSIKSVQASQEGGASFRELQSRLFRTAAQSVELLSFRDPIHTWSTVKKTLVPSLVDELDESGEGLAALDAQLTFLLMRSAVVSSEAPDGILARQVEKYDRMLKAFWGANRTLCEREEKEASSIPVPRSIMEPFLHDAHFAGLATTVATVECLIAALASVDARYVVGRDSLGRTLLHVAAECLRPRDVRVVLRQGLDVNAQDMFGRTALHVACESSSSSSEEEEQQLEIVGDLLREPGLDVRARDVYGFLAVDYAVQDRRLDILRLFQRVHGPGALIDDDEVREIENYRDVVGALHSEQQKRRRHRLLFGG
ncbi:hypothetical protein F4809DRAFT_391722 [Biscogniauxia mediterranea]|nr:hypothetical protein F4809DRAFT_391722 [Biscogniauxia mediterranea]